jgi:FkbM family methyltransferase
VTSHLGRQLIYGVGGVLTRVAGRDWGRATAAVQWLYLIAHVAGKRLLDGRGLRALVALAQPGMVVCDVGANIGVTAVALARRVGPQGSVLAFEPFPFNVAIFRRHVARAGVANIVLSEVALGDRVETRYLRMNKTNRADLRIVPAAAAPPPASLAVACETLDTALSRLAVSRVDLVKIDVQGFEPMVLRGMRRTLTANPDIQLVVEFYPEGIVEQGEKPLDLLETLFERFARIHRWTGREWRPLERDEAIPWVTRMGPSDYTDLWCRG